MPRDYYLGCGSFRSQHDWLRADQRARQRGLHFVPHQQQLHFGDRADRLWKLRLSFDDLAANEYSSPLHIRIGIRRGELFHLPHDNRLDRSGVRSQCYRVCLDGHAHVAVADALRLLPCEQQLHPQFGGLLWVPPGSIPEHDNDWRECPEPRHVRVSDNGFGVRDVPHDHHLGRGSFQSQHDGLPPDQCPRQRGLQFVPRGQQLYLSDRANRLREFGMPFDDLAANEYSSALHIRIGIRRGELFYLPYHNRLDRSCVRSHRYWVCLDRNAHVANADTLRLLPCEQQLHSQFG